MANAAAPITENEAKIIAPNENTAKPTVSPTLNLPRPNALQDVIFNENSSASPSGTATPASPESQLNIATTFINGTLKHIDIQIKTAQSELDQHDQNYRERPVTDQYFDWRFDQNEKYFEPKRKALAGTVGLLQEQRTDLLESSELLRKAQIDCQQEHKESTKKEIVSRAIENAARLLDKNYDNSDIRALQLQAEKGRSEIYGREGTVLADCIVAGTVLGGPFANLARNGFQLLLPQAASGAASLGSELTTATLPKATSPIGASFARLFARSAGSSALSELSNSESEVSAHMNRQGIDDNPYNRFATRTWLEKQGVLRTTQKPAAISEAEAPYTSSYRPNTRPASDPGENASAHDRAIYEMWLRQNKPGASPEPAARVPTREPLTPPTKNTTPHSSPQTQSKAPTADSHPYDHVTYDAWLKHQPISAK